MNTNDLLELKNRVDEAKNNITRLEGKKIVKLENLMENWNVRSIAAAKVVLGKKKSELAEFTKKLEKTLKHLEDTYGELIR